MDGWVTIGTKLDTKGLEQGLKKANSELKQYEKEAERLTTSKTKIEEDQTGLQKQINEYETLTNKADEYHQKIRQIESSMREMEANADGGIGVVFDPKYMQLEDSAEALKLKEQEVVAEIDKMAPKIDKAYTSYEKNENKLEEIGSQIQENKNKQTELNSKISEMNSRLAQSKGFDAVRGSIDNINQGLSHTISRVGHWLIGIFGVYSAYSAVRGAMNTLSQYNSQLAVDIEYIRFALASTLEPIILKLIQLAFTLLTYINYIAQAWFGVNLFAGASVGKFTQAEESSKNIADNTGKAAQNAKDLRKQLTGFDEMNVLNDNVKSSGSGSGGSVGGAAGGALPSWDLSSLKNVKIPEWIDWIAKNGKTVATIIGAIATALLSLKLAKFIYDITGATTSLAAFKAGLALVSAGIVLLVGSIVNLILNWDEMTTKQKVLSVALATLGAAFVALGYAIATGISAATLGIGALIAAAIALISTIVTLTAKLITEKKAILDVKDANKELKKSKEELKSATNEYISAVDNEKQTMNDLKKAQNETGLSGKELYKKIQNGTLDYKNMNSAQQEVYKAYLAHKDAQDKLKTSTEQLNKAKQNQKDASWNQKLAIAAEKGELDKYRDSVVKAYKDGKISAQDAQKYISKAMTGISKDSETAFTKDIPKDIKDGLDSSKYKTKMQKFKDWWNDNISKLKRSITIDIVGNSTKLNSGKTVKFAKGGVYVPPRLASGGIVNMPGRGVPLGGAIAGERGPEGVIPLTDSQQMALLGEAIGKYINVSLTNITKLDNREIAREQKKINAQSDFAFNR